MDPDKGTVKRGSATCPVCGYTTPVVSVRQQLKARRGGSNDARLFCVVTTRLGNDGRTYRLPRAQDMTVFLAASEQLSRLQASSRSSETILPNEVIPPTEIRRVSVPIYGMATWGDLFSHRQALTMSTLVRLLRTASEELKRNYPPLELAVTAVLGLAISRFSDICNALCMWETTKTQVRHMFTRQAIGMLWDYAEPNVFADAAGNFITTLSTMIGVLEREALASMLAGHVEQASAAEHPMPDDSADMFMTDPPYYDAVPYAHLSDFFYVWLKRSLQPSFPDIFSENEVPKNGEIVVDRPHELSRSAKDIAFYEAELTEAFAEGRRVLRPNGTAVVVFASKSTASWESILKAVVGAGWIISGSWPIDTEMATRLAAQGQARLASSVHLVCRPRENANGSLRGDDIGDWRDVLRELPDRIHEWLPRLADEGVVGADAIFACLGPALEVFSRYSRVEKASGELVTLREYLEHVWAAVSKEALTLVFKDLPVGRQGADSGAEGLEEDARLTAMWLWTLSADRQALGSAQTAENARDAEEDAEEAEEEAGVKKAASGGYTLEYDAARKIAQGLGAHLEALTSLVEVKGDKATLLPVMARTRRLFGKDEAVTQSHAGRQAGREGAKGGRKTRAKQMDMFVTLEQLEAEDLPDGRQGPQDVTPAPGTTVLDRVHQAMILFSAGRSEAMRRFLVDDPPAGGQAVGNHPRFWSLAQALSALYPSNSDEKRWVDGVLARKKGLGF